MTSKTKHIDFFGSCLNEGDVVLYVPYSEHGTRLQLGTIKKIGTDLFQTITFVYIKEDPEAFTIARLCVKFSQDELVMKKVKSNL